MKTLVEKLSTGKHPVSLIRYKNVEELKDAIDRKFVLVKFTDTQGGTELGITLDSGEQKVLPETGEVDLCGSLILDYQPVKCSINIDVCSLSGSGSLQTESAL